MLWLRPWWSVVATRWSTASGQHRHAWWCPRRQNEHYCARTRLPIDRKYEQDEHSLARAHTRASSSTLCRVVGTNVELSRFIAHYGLWSCERRLTMSMGSHASCWESKLTSCEDLAFPLLCSRMRAPGLVSHRSKILLPLSRRRAHGGTGTMPGTFLKGVVVAFGPQIFYQSRFVLGIETNFL